MGGRRSCRRVAIVTRVGLGLVRECVGRLVLRGGCVEGTVGL